MEQIHKLIMAHKNELRVGLPHYNALAQMHDDLVLAIKVVTNDVPPWAKWGTTGPVLPAHSDI